MLKINREWLKDVKDCGEMTEDKSEKMLREYLYDDTNCVSIDEAITEAKKKWPREKKKVKRKK